MSRALGGYVGHIPVPSTSSAPGMWTLREASRYRRAGTWPTTGDPNFANVSLLLHMDGSNGSTTFTDSSGTPKTVTANGNAQISTAQGKFGGASCLLDGNGDYLRVPSDSALSFPSDFTIECWIRAASAPTMAGIAVRRVLDSSGSGAWGLSVENGVARFSNLGFSVTVTSFGNVSLNTWTHVAASRSGSTLRLFLDGQLNATVSNSTDFTNTHDLFIGAWGRAGGGSTPTEGWFDGYIDEFRITKGVARYTANFTPPTAPFPDE